METVSRLLNPIFGFFLTLAFGLWLSRRGRPYNGLLFNIHKLVALGTVILAAMEIYRMSKVMDFESLVFILLVVTALSVVTLFLSGAFMSAHIGEYRVVKLIHNIAPVVAVVAAGYALFLLTPG